MYLSNLIFFFFRNKLLNIEISLYYVILNIIYYNFLHTLRYKSICHNYLTETMHIYISIKLYYYAIK